MGTINRGYFGGVNVLLAGKANKSLDLNTIIQNILKL
jgi:hypothetical protein